MAKAAKAETVDQQPEQKGSKLKWIIIGVVVFLVVSGAGGGFYFYTKSSGHKKPVEKPKPVIGIIWPMDSFIVNLADVENPRYLKVIIKLEVADPLTVAELDLLKPKVRDGILDLLTAKTQRDLVDLGGKQRLRDEIAAQVSGFLKKGKIEKVYFEEFVIQ